MTNWRKRLAGLTVGWALMSVTVDAWAQDFGMVLFNDSMALTQNYVAQAALASVANANAESVATSGKGKARLDFSNDQTISREVRDDFRHQLIAAQPDATDRIERAVSQDWLAGYRNEIARPNELDPNNLADALTAYMIASWTAVNFLDQLSAEGIAAVRQQMRDALSRSPEVAAMSAADRQRMGEMLIYNTVLVMANRTEIFITGNRELQRTMAEHYRAQFAALGIDMASLSLTRTGFTRKGP